MEKLLGLNWANWLALVFTLSTALCIWIMIDQKGLGESLFLRDDEDDKTDLLTIVGIGAIFVGVCMLSLGLLVAGGQVFGGGIALATGNQYMQNNVKIKTQSTPTGIKTTVTKSESGTSPPPSKMTSDPPSPSGR